MVIGIVLNKHLNVLFICKVNTFELCLTNFVITNKNYCQSYYLNQPGYIKNTLL